MNTELQAGVSTHRQRLFSLVAALSTACLITLVVTLAVLTATAHADDSQPPHSRTTAPAATVFLFVDRSDDANVTTCADAVNDCTLRGAINKANGDSANIYHIYFTSTVTTINLTGTLPTVVVSGTWIVGNSGSPRIDGSGLPDGSSAFVVNALGARLGSLSIVNVPSTTATADISITGGSRIIIDYNYLGTLPPAGIASCTPSGVTRNAAYGVYVSKAVVGSAADNNRSAYIIGNTIGCHTSDGIHLAGADHVHIGKASDASPQGNFIGVNANRVALPNQRAGIDLEAANTDAAQFNDIFANTIAGNVYGGLLVSGCNCVNNLDSNWIHGNRIGLAPNGTALGNGTAGIWLDTTTENMIGGLADADRNVVSGNSGDGVKLNFADNNSILNNFIGTDIGGTAPIANSGSGLKLNMSNGNFIGSLGLSAGTFRANLISGNTGNGIWLTYGSDNLIGGNVVGGNVSGTLALGNQQSGILLGVGSTNNTVGGVNQATGNLIMGNPVGIALQNSQVATNTIVYNTIRANQSQGIVLGSGTFNNTIGGNSSAEANTIEANHLEGISVNDSPRNRILVNTIDHNSSNGILLTGSNAIGTIISGTVLHHNSTGITECCGAASNTWSHLSTYDNIGLGIDKNNGPTLNLPDPPYLFIDSINRSTGAVHGRSNGSILLTFTTVELYRVATDASGYGEGKTFVGSALTDSNGNWTIIDPVTGGGCYTAFISTIVLVPAGSSEFSLNTCRVLLPTVLK